MDAKVIAISSHRKPQMTSLEAIQHLYWSWWATSFGVGVAMLDSFARYGFPTNKDKK